VREPLRSAPRPLRQRRRLRGVPGWTDVRGQRSGQRVRHRTVHPELRGQSVWGERRLRGRVRSGELRNRPALREWRVHMRRDLVQRLLQRKYLRGGRHECRVWYWRRGVRGLRERHHLRHGRMRHVWRQWTGLLRGEHVCTAAHLRGRRSERRLRVHAELRGRRVWRERRLRWRLRVGELRRRRALRERHVRVRLDVVQRMLLGGAVSRRYGGRRMRQRRQGVRRVPNRNVPSGHVRQP
jgi:hypothetical protein